MKPTAFLLALSLAAGCAPDFVVDAQPVTLREATPANQAEAQLTLPARIGLVRRVYNRPIHATGAETELWEDMTRQAAPMGTFVPLQATSRDLRTAAAAQRLNYLLILDLDPERGTAEARFIDVESGALFATATAGTAPVRGFWGGELRNATRLTNVTYDMAQTLAPDVARMLTGLAARGL